MAVKERLRILVIGSGGREHAFAWKLSQSSIVDTVYVAPGNGGTEASSSKASVVNVNISVENVAELVAFSRKHGINLVVPGPEAPLVAGIQGDFQAVGIRCFGPSKKAARMEGSKAFSKDFMRRHHIPTARYESFSDYENARQYLDSIDSNVVIKADGLAAGKGVIIPKHKKEAQQALTEIMVERQFGDAGDQVVIEEFLDGEELSVLSFSDGHLIKSLPPAQDHKRIFDGDKGPNTGGMGCYAPTRVASPELIAEIDRTIVQPTIDGMRKEGMPFRGILFTGIMVTDSGPKVLEYNVRGGDPETQTLLPLLSKDTDLAKIMVASADGHLDSVQIHVDNKFSATVVAAAPGYPGSYTKNISMQLDNPPQDTIIFQAGTALDGGKVRTTGGRVIAGTGTAGTLEAAVAKAYEAMKAIHFEGMHYRKDIAHRAFKAQSHGASQPDSQEAMTYASAGVSIEAGNDLVARIKSAVKSTARSGTDAVIGGFGGVFSLPHAGYDSRSPTIIGAIDGVGTKLKVAHKMNKHDTVGIDLVAMNVNDLIVQGAEPLFVLDCYSCSALNVESAANFVGGVAEGCRLANCALIGGETAEMPGMYQSDDYDAVAAAVGAVSHGSKILPDLEGMVEGDVLLGLSSSGVHSNGFSLIRKILERQGINYYDKAPWDPETNVGLSILTPTRIYVQSLLKVVKRDLIKGMSHITGGGLIENIPRMIPQSLTAEVDVESWGGLPKVFAWLKSAGNVSAVEMSRAFNNGIGMVLVVSSIAAGEVKKILEAEGEIVHNIGNLRKRKAGGGCVLVNLESWDSR